MLRRALPFFVAVLGVSSVVTGCSSIDSEDIDTDAITAVFTVSPRADGSATDVRASLSAGTFNFVDLSPEDKLIATADDKSVELQKNDLLGAVEYRGTLDGVGAPGTEVVIAFTRTRFPSAPESSVEIAGPVTIEAPAASTEFSRADDDIVVELAASDAPDDVTITWQGSCIQTGSIDVPAGQTSVTIAAGTIQKAEPEEDDPESEPVPDTCTFSIGAERRVTGTLDPAFGGGSITSVASDSVDLTTKP